MTTELRIQASGLELAATELGSASDRPIVLLHGGGQTRHAWGSAGDAFASRGWHAVAVDLRGHGDSDWAPDGDYSLSALGHDVRAIARTVGAPPALVGASLGGLASLIAVGEAEEPVAAALVLVDVAPKVELEGARRIRQFMIDGMDGFERLEDAADAIAAYLPSRPKPDDLSGLRKNLRWRDGRWRWHWDPEFLRGGREGLDGQEGLVRHQRLIEAARRVEIPTLLVHGGRSEIVGRDGVAELQELIPHAEVVEVSEAGHMVVGDRNDAFNEAVLEFLHDL